jgi:Rod binding domain-containing protein
MDTGSLNTLTRLGQRPEASISTRDAARLDDLNLFANVMQRARQDSEASKQANESPRAAAENFVSIALVEPIFKKLRESNQSAGPFAPGQVEKSFRGMLDRTLSQKIVQSGHWGLVQKVEESISKRAGYQPAPQGVAPVTDLRASSNAQPLVRELDAGSGPAVNTSLANDPARKPAVTILNTPSTTPRVVELPARGTR